MTGLQYRYAPGTLSRRLFMFKVAYPDTIARRLRQKWKIICKLWKCVDGNLEPNPWSFTLWSIYPYRGLSRDADYGDELKTKQACAWFTCSCIVISVGYDSVTVLVL